MDALFSSIENEESTLLTNQIITGCLDMQGCLWLGTDGDGLLRYDRKRMYSYVKDCRSTYV